MPFGLGTIRSSKSGDQDTDGCGIETELHEKTERGAVVIGYVEAKTPVGKTIMSIFFTVMAVVGLIAGLDAGGQAWIIFLVFGSCAVLAWRNTLAHQRYLQEQARKFGAR